MASRDPRAVVTLEIEPTPRPAPIEVGPETPFCIALLGDFGGRDLRAAPASADPPLAGRRPLAVDRDNLDAVLRAVAPEIVVPLDSADAPRARIRFAEMEDFTPERLVARMEVFPALRAAARGAPPAGQRAGTGGAAGPGTAPGAAEAEPTGNGTRSLAADLSAGSLLDRMLEEAGGEPAAPASPSSGAATMEDFLRRITAPHLVREEAPDAAAARRLGESLVAEQLRRILHDPRFQALEALWRTVFFLTRRLETGHELRLSLVNVSRAEFAADLGAAGGGALRQLLSENAPAAGTAPWALLVGLYAFGPGEEDVALLAGAAALAREVGAPFVAGAEPALVGARDFATGADPDGWAREPAPAWAAFRRTPEARHVGLALPRFMLRLPYGREGELCEVPGFEEAAEPPRHEEYLWGNAAAVCALLLAQGFSLTGWDLRPGAIAEVGGLPLHLYRSGGETLAWPCAETWLGERAADRILERGPMALASMKNQDSVRLVRFQSVADPLAALAGRWAQEHRP